MNELERVEAQAIREAVALGGGRAALVGGASCVAHTLPIPELNRAQPLGASVDVAAIAQWFGPHPHIVNVTPESNYLDAALRAAGYQPGYAWMKFDRDTAPPPPTDTDLRVEATLDADAFAVASGEGFGIPPDLSRVLSAIVGAPGWTCFLAWDGSEPAACGALYLDAKTAWIGIGATRPAYRRRGAQSALLGARISAAVAAGATRFTTETGVLVEGRPNQSYRNILRAGFREAYVRANWQSPA